MWENSLLSLSLNQVFLLLIIIKMAYKFEPPYYPIVYVRGYAEEQEDKLATAVDPYYGFATLTEYNKQLNVGHGHVLSHIYKSPLWTLVSNSCEDNSTVLGYQEGEKIPADHDESINPSKSIWLSRVCALDSKSYKQRSMKKDALELLNLLVYEIPKKLVALGMNEDTVRNDYKVILIAHGIAGLVCRTMMQNLLPDFKLKKDDEVPILALEKITDPEKLIHKFVTIGTPHKGHDMGTQDSHVTYSVYKPINPYNANGFASERMREYLKLTDLKFDTHSLGNSTFPLKRCLCIIGSDHTRYHSNKDAPAFSDGVVKQDHAYLVGAERPADNAAYDEKNVAFYANIHRAQTGVCGMVPSVESWAHIQRFLFGDLRVRIALDNLAIHTKQTEEYDYFYDFEFAYTVKGCGVYLHRRQLDPCENPIRLGRSEVGAKELFLHNAFLDSKRTYAKTGSHFMMKIAVQEYRADKSLHYDAQYPSRTIYSENLEVRIKYCKGKIPNYCAQYSWQGDNETWNDFAYNPNGDFVVSLVTNPVLAEKVNVTGDIVLRAFDWTVG